MRILLVDDRGASMAVMRRSLTSLGHEVITADSAESALKTLERLSGTGGSVGLLFTDFDMPERNGVELVNAARAAGYAGPTILCSSDPLGKIRKICESKGVPTGEIMNFFDRIYAEDERHLRRAIEKAVAGEGDATS